MNKFFRDLRMRFLSENKISKYLIYALGEILLIVIGILIALQIDKWNQNKVRENKEVEILKLLRSDLTEGIAEFDQSIAQYSKAKHAIETVISHLESNKSYNDSLKFHFFNTMLYWGTSDLTNSNFETLKDIGIDLISNSALRNRITIVFDEYDAWIEKDENRYVDILIDLGKNVLNTRFNEYWDGEFIDGEYVGEMIPLNYESLKSDQEYLFSLKSLKNQMKWLIEEPINSTRHEALELIEEIDSELAQLTSN